MRSLSLHQRAVAQDYRRHVETGRGSLQKEHSDVVQVCAIQSQKDTCRVLWSMMLQASQHQNPTADCSDPLKRWPMLGCYNRWGTPHDTGTAQNQHCDRTQQTAGHWDRP